MKKTTTKKQNLQLNFILNLIFYIQKSITSIGIVFQLEVQHCNDYYKKNNDLMLSCTGSGHCCATINLKEIWLKLKTKRNQRVDLFIVILNSEHKVQVICYIHVMKYSQPW